MDEDWIDKWRLETLRLTERSERHPKGFDYGLSGAKKKGTNMSERPTREVMDLSLTAYLLCMGSELVGLARSGEDNRFTFTLTEIDDMENVILDFYNKKGRVDPLNYAEILRNLKAMLRSRKEIKR